MKYITHIIVALVVINIAFTAYVYSRINAFAEDISTVFAQSGILQNSSNGILVNAVVTVTAFQEFLKQVSDNTAQ